MILSLVVSNRIALIERSGSFDNYYSGSLSEILTTSGWISFVYRFIYLGDSCSMYEGSLVLLRLIAAVLRLIFSIGASDYSSLLPSCILSSFLVKSYSCSLSLLSSISYCFYSIIFSSILSFSNLSIDALFSLMISWAKMMFGKLSLYLLWSSWESFWMSFQC